MEVEEMLYVEDIPFVSFYTVGNYYVLSKVSNSRNNVYVCIQICVYCLNDGSSQNDLSTVRFLLLTHFSHS